MGNTFFKKLCVAILGFALPTLALAAGLGRLTVLSGLGQPLKAEIEVVALQPGEADTLAAMLAPVESFRQANVEFTSALQSIRFAIERRPNNQYVISLTSNQPMNEPFIDLLVELSWSAGRLVREYTFLLDPPELKPTVATPTPPVVPPVVAPLPEEAPRAAAPAPAPEAAVAAPTVVAKPAAKPAGQYEVKRGDTLSRIAAQNMVPGASLQRMLAAMYRGNQDAFDGKNMNRLRTGRILTLPGAADVEAISQNEASQLVRSQAADYAEYQRSIGAAVVAAPARAEGSRQAAGRITAPVEEKPAAKGPAADQLRLSKPDDAKGTGKGAAAARGDDLAAKDKALREAQERVALLEKNVQDLQKLLQLKSAAGAQAQAEAAKAAPAKAAPAAPAKAETKAEAKPEAKAEAKGDTGKGSAPAAKAEPPKAAAPAVDASKVVAPGAKPAAETAAADAAKTDAAKPAAEAAAAPEASKAAPKPVAKAPPPPPPEPPGFIDELLDNEMAIAGAGGVVILLAGYAAYAWRRKKRDASAGFVDSSVSAPAIAAASIASSAMDTDSAPAPVPAHGAAAKAEGEDIDPIAEADVYMAYGRDTQAEEILKEALAKDTNLVPAWVKLLEIYANRKDARTFESTALDLQTVTGGQGPDWEKAQALGLQLDPSNPLYGGSGGADLAATQILPGGPAVAAAAAAAATEAVVDEAPAEVEQGEVVASAALDFDLDLGEAPAQQAAAVDLDLGAGPADQTAAEPAAEAAGSTLDFDLGLGGDVPAATDSASAPPAVDSSAATASADSGATIDFDLGMSTDAPAPAAEAAPAATADAGSTMDFNLNLDAPEAAAPAAASPAASADIDLSAISLDMGTESAPSAAPMDAKWQEVATKLDLAKAYDEMGDKDGARDLLNEVMQEGDAAQKQQAKTMLDALA